MNLELVMIMFDEENAAIDAYEIVRKLHKDGAIEIQDAATLVKQRDGTSRIQDARDVDAPDGGLFGIIAGGLIGLIGGPLGSIIGAVAGGATGVMSASLIDLGFPREDLQALRDQLSPGSSALIVLLEPVWRDKLDAALAEYGGMSTRRALRGASAPDSAAAHEAIAEMRKAIADRRGGRA
ncbi:MAG TPA: DUF1269 domain-containing protein [Roseiflexaceae bacterium]|nr:DUF1269 domain-containing protein [Roseiflexaceae bacterium]